MEQPKKKKILDKLKFRYRVVIINDETFKEQSSFTLSLMNLIVFIGSLSLFMIFLLTYVIAFTSLREYIPGYADVNLRKSITKISLLSDSLLTASAEKDLYLKNIQNIINEKVTKEDLKNLDKNKSTRLDSSKLEASESELDFRKDVTNRNKHNITQQESSLSGISGLLFFPPLVGSIKNTKLKTSLNYHGIDIVSQANQPIKSTLNGTVISTGWSHDLGYIIHIQHEENLVSVYTNNSALLKVTGDKVKAGDPIAIIGNSSENLKLPHLHFELWYKGSSLDPQEYIRF